MTDGTDGRMTKKEFSTESIWKVAAALIGYLLMGMWMTAKISAGYDVLKGDITDIKSQINSLSARMDKHIDQSK